MALARVQATPQTVANSASVAVTFAAPPTVGNGIVVAVVSFTNIQVTGVTDNHGHTYTRAVVQTQGGVPSTIELFVCAKTTASGAPFTITVAGGATDRLVVAVEVSGVGGGLVLDQSLGASGSGGLAATGSTAALTTTADAFVVAVVGSSSNSYTVETVTPTWLQEAEELGTARGEVDSRVLVSATGTTPSASWTLNGANFWAAAVAAFKAGVVAPGIVAGTRATAAVLFVPSLLGSSPLPGTMDQYRNLAYGIIDVAPSPPLYGTSVRVRTARPNLWPPPPFNATVWPVNTMPTHANAEIVRVTGVAGPVLTFLRAQEGTTEKAMAVGDQIANTITKKLLDDLRAIKGGDGSTSGIPTIHHETHEPGGYDEILALDASNLAPGTSEISLLATGGIVFGAAGDGALVMPTAQWNITGEGDLLPWSDKVYDIGSPTAYVRHLYVQSATLGTIVGGLPSHQATHQKGAADEIANVAWTNRQNTFAGNQTIAVANPALVLSDTTQAVDARNFLITNSGGTWKVQAYNDLFTTLQSTGLTINRAGQVTVPNLVASGTYPQIRVWGSSVALISFRDTAAAVDQKIFRVWTGGGTFKIDALNDAETALIGPTNLTLNRTGGATIGGVLCVTGAGAGGSLGYLQIGGAATQPMFRSSYAGTADILEVVTGDNARYAQVTARNFVSTTNANNLADLTCGPTNFTAGVTVSAGGSSFAGKIDVTGGSATGYSTAPIEVRMTSYPRVSFHWPGVVASQLGMDNAGTITAFDNPGTSYANFRALGIYAVGGFYGPKPPRTLALGAGTNVNPDCNVYDMYCWDAINVSASIQNPVNPKEGFSLIIRFRDQGAACPIYWGTAWTSHCASPLPAATVAPAKTTWCAFRYNGYYGQWHMLSVTTEP